VRRIWTELEADPIHKFERAFKGIRLQAGLHREGGSRLQPRLHDLRHTMLKSLGQKTTVGEEFGMTFLEY
jgi:hypothetical protein